MRVVSIGKLRQEDITCMWLRVLRSVLKDLSDYDSRIRLEPD